MTGRDAMFTLLKENFFNKQAATLAKQNLAEDVAHHMAVEIGQYSGEKTLDEFKAIATNKGHDFIRKGATRYRIDHANRQGVSLWNGDADATERKIKNGRTKLYRSPLSPDQHRDRRTPAPIKYAMRREGERAFLDRDEREIYDLKREGHSVDDIARKVGKSARTVYETLTRISNHMKRFI